MRSFDPNSTAARVLLVLRENGIEDLADELEGYLLELSSDDDTVRAKASENIVGLSHVRVLGDLWIETISGREWSQLLEKLRRYARRKGR